MLYTMSSLRKIYPDVPTRGKKYENVSELDDALKGNKNQLPTIYANLHDYVYSRYDPINKKAEKEDTSKETLKEYEKRYQYMLKIEEILKDKYSKGSDILSQGRLDLAKKKSEIKQTEQLGTSASGDDEPEPKPAGTKNVDVEYKEGMPPKTKAEKEAEQEAKIAQNSGMKQIGDFPGMEGLKEKPKTELKQENLPKEADKPITEEQKQANEAVNREKGIKENHESKITELEMFPSTKPVDKIGKIKQYSLIDRINSYNKAQADKYTIKSRNVLPTATNIEKLLGVRISRYTHHETPQPKPQKIPDKFDLSHGNTYRDD
jgi:hypothetical protein